jgi:hypothetical protein
MHLLLRTRLLASAVAVIAVLLAGTACSDDSDEAAASDDARLIHEHDGQREDLGLFPAGEAVARAEELAGFDILLPERLPDDRLQLAHVGVSTAPTGVVSYAEAAWYRGDEFEPGQPSLVIKYLSPERPLRAGGAPDEESVEVSGVTVHIVSRQSADFEATNYTVISDTLPMDISTADIPREPVLTMIEEMLAR